MKKIVLLCLLLGLSACATSHEDALPVDTEYILGTGDHLHVTVFGDEQLSGDFKVSAAGYVSLPLIRSVKAKGLTIEQLENAITDKLYPKYMNDPKVSVEVREYRNIYVLGEVRAPGKYSYEPNMTTLQAVATAGGFTYRADEDGARISRIKNGKVKKLDLYDDEVISPGDTIYVERRWF